MGWATGGILRRWKILSGPSPVLPDFLPDSQGTGGLPGCTGLGCRWWSGVHPSTGYHVAHVPET